MIVCKTVMTFSASEKKVRLWRWLFGDVRPSAHKGYYTAKYSFGLSLIPSLFRWLRSVSGWELTLMGLRGHFKRGLGGRCV